MEGSRMYIYKQDPSIKEPGMRSTFIPSKVQPGPSDDLIRIADVGAIDPDENGDFLVFPEEDRMRFDAVHAFAVCRQVLTMYERAFNRLGILKPEDKNEKGFFDFKGKWEKPLDLYVRAIDKKLCAFYTPPTFNTIYFGYKGDVFTCRSFDVIAHETGHAVFEALKKGKHIQKSNETLALEEAFCDLTAVFTLLSQMDMCEAVIALSKGNLSPEKNPLFIAGIAEQYGMHKYQRFALRDVSRKYKYSEVIQGKYDNYDLSLVFSGAIYNFLEKVFTGHICLDRYDPAETLFRLGRLVTEITLGAYYSVINKSHLTFKNICIEMMKMLNKMEMKDEYSKFLLRDKKWSLLLLNIFNEHEIILTE